MGFIPVVVAVYFAHFAIGIFPMFQALHKKPILHKNSRVCTKSPSERSKAETGVSFDIPT